MSIQSSAEKCSKCNIPYQYCQLVEIKDQWRALYVYPQCDGDVVR